MHTVRYLPVDPPTTPATSLYYVGFTDAAAAWSPFVSCNTLHEAMQVVSFLNGGQRPASLTPWTNCMDTSGTPVSSDFKRGKPSAVKVDTSEQPADHKPASKAEANHHD